MGDSNHKKNSQISNEQNWKRSTNSLFSFSRWNNKNQKKPGFVMQKQNLKFLQNFKIVYDQISSDLVSRLEELKHVHDLLEMGKEYNLCEDKLGESMNLKLQMMNQGTDLPIITDRDETTDRTEYHKSLTQTAPGASTKKQQSVMSSLKLDWEGLTQAESLIGTFLHDSQFYFD